MGFPAVKSAKSVFSNRCLLVSAGNNTNGAPATQNDCNPAYADQVWNV